MNTRSIAISLTLLSLAWTALGAGCTATVEDGPVGSTSSPLQKCSNPVLGCGEYDTWGVPYQLADCEQPGCCTQGGGWVTSDPTVQTFLTTLQGSGCAEPKAYAKNGSTNWYLYSLCPSSASSVVGKLVTTDETTEPLMSWRDVESPSVCLAEPTGGFYVFYDPGCPNCLVAPKKN